jgi:hypothetical protein
LVTMPLKVDSLYQPPEENTHATIKVRTGSRRLEFSGLLFPGPPNLNKFTRRHGWVNVLVGWAHTNTPTNHKEALNTTHLRNWCLTSNYSCCSRTGHWLPNKKLIKLRVGQCYTSLRPVEKEEGSLELRSPESCSWCECVGAWSVCPAAHSSKIREFGILEISTCSEMSFRA